VLADLTELAAFQREPWNSGYLQGIVDASFLNLTPGTRTGVIQDGAFENLCRILSEVEDALVRIIAEQRRAEEERASQKMLGTIRQAFREALLALPAEEYDWFDIQKAGQGRALRSMTTPDGMPVTETVPDNVETEDASPETAQKQFFEYAGPLFSVSISPRSSVVPVGQSRTYRAIARDRKRYLVEHNLTFQWELVEGVGTLDNDQSEIVTFTAPEQPGLTRM
jgi:hypothetical protein